MEKPPAQGEDSGEDGGAPPLPPFPARTRIFTADGGSKKRVCDCKRLVTLCDDECPRTPMRQLQKAQKLATDAQRRLQGRPTFAQAAEAVRTLLHYIGDDPDRPGVQDTPARVLRAWNNAWGQGYQEDPPELRMFPEEGIDYNQIVLVDKIDFFSTCEHHMAPFFGVAHIAYIPRADRGVLGISKFARVVEYFARRLQVQERLTAQVADFLVEHVSPDVAVVMQATHLCMVSRGVRQPHAQTKTAAIRGDFNEPATRAEFYRLLAA